MYPHFACALPSIGLVLLRRSSSRWPPTPPRSTFWTESEYPPLSSYALARMHPRSVTLIVRIRSIACASTSCAPGFTRMLLRRSYVPVLARHHSIDTEWSIVCPPWFSHLEGSPLGTTRMIVASGNLFRFMTLAYSSSFDHPRLYASIVYSRLTLLSCQQGASYSARLGYLSPARPQLTPPPPPTIEDRIPSTCNCGNLQRTFRV